MERLLAFGLMENGIKRMPIGNNHHENVIPGEDFQMFEKDLPGKST
jgi:alpha-L-fucosidase